MKAKCIKPLCVDGYQFEEGKEYDIEWKEFVRERDDHDPVLGRGHRVRHIQYAVKYNFLFPKMFGKGEEKVPAMLYLYDRQYCEHEDYMAPAIDPLGLTGGPLLCFDDFFKEVHDVAAAQPSSNGRWCSPDLYRRNYLKQQIKRINEREMMDVTRNAVWTEDCCGKMDLDFPILDCDTRYWTDNTCKCHIWLCSGVYLYREHTLHEPFDPITIIESDYIEGNSKEECQMKARQWYNEHVVQALELAILKIKAKED